MQVETNAAGFITTPGMWKGVHIAAKARIEKEVTVMRINFPEREVIVLRTTAIKAARLTHAEA